MTASEDNSFRNIIPYIQYISHNPYNPQAMRI